MKILIFGKGYIGTECALAWGEEAVLSDVRVQSKEDALKEILAHKPDAVLNAAGVVGKPNVDWCDDHQIESARGNTIVPILIADACQEAGVYLLHIGTGCIFYGPSHHEDKAWREDDFGNPEPVYTRTKMAADLVLSTLPNVGIARIRMPIHHKPGGPNLIDKLARYNKIIDVHNSVTIMEDMIYAFYELMRQKGQGIFHVTNPGIMHHRVLIDLYKEYVDPAKENEWIQESDLVAQGLATKSRSNNFLNSDRLEALGIKMRHIDEALRDTMEKYAKNRV
jgi:3,5-epimerase/4-reductase